ncbi:hypothetical protein [Devosia sp. YR412]|uniref:hypothetical protein n=1 Tax=Devosia sp. YR412 TaxID=1881030 RepID=UPI001FCD79D9|nr:hypothetical protein [Devosia sp. YR412]
MQRQSSVSLQAFHTHPRLSSIFATQQRFLLAHAALALMFRQGGPETPWMTSARFLREVAIHEIASRNTADSFIKEMLHYGYVVATRDPNDRRAKRLSVTPETLRVLDAWAKVQLATLDRLDHGHRLRHYMSKDHAFERLELELGQGVLTNAQLRRPQRTFSLFTWLNNGGVIMDWLISNLQERYADGTRYTTSIRSLGELAGWVKLSRTHLGRKLREAETLGSMGWSGERGASYIWVSAEFVREMIDAQATKLSVIDAACQRSGMR